MLKSLTCVLSNGDLLSASSGLSTVPRSYMSHIERLTVLGLPAVLELDGEVPLVGFQEV
jgi:hypothetical protein